MLRIISGKWRRRQLIMPPSIYTRPTTDRIRESLFNILSHCYGLGLTSLTVADLFSGSGALGLECLSRGAQHVTFVEDNSIVIKSLLKTIANLNVDNSNFNILPTTIPPLPYKDKAVDLVFLDPPYAKGLIPLTCQSLLANGWLKDSTLIVTETAATDTPTAINGFTLDQRRQYGNSVLSFWRIEL